MKTLFTLAAVVFSMFQVQGAMADSFARITCDYKYRFGVHVENRDGEKAIVYTSCKDGDDQNYEVSFVQKFGVDLLLDKGISNGYLVLFCAGTEIKGTYGAGAVGGLGALFGGVRGGAFVSLKGEQGACAIVDGAQGTVGGQLDAEKLTIK